MKLQGPEKRSKYTKTKTKTYNHTTNNQQKNISKPMDDAGPVIN